MGFSAAISSTPRLDDVPAPAADAAFVRPDRADLRGSRSARDADLVRRVIARCQSTDDDAMADERHRATDLIGQALSSALLGKPVLVGDDVSDDVLTAVFERARTETHAALTRGTSRSSADAVRLWMAFDTVGRSLAQRRRSSGILGDAELRLLSEVVHDLRSPLSSILLLSDALGQRFQGSGDEVSERQAGLIRGAALAMHELVTDLRDLARGAHALMDPAPLTFSLSEVIGTIEHLVRPLAEEQGLAFRVSLPERLLVTGHPTALTRVLLNLTTNGLKFTERGFVEIAGSVAPNGRATFTVRDTGGGLPPRIVALIEGEPLSRGHSPARIGGELGVGLGLSLCVRLVRLMGGTIHVRETSLTGTCIAVEVPMATVGNSDRSSGLGQPLVVEGQRAEARCADMA